jgi:hypothetical protein
MVTPRQSSYTTHSALGGIGAIFFSCVLEKNGNAYFENDLHDCGKQTGTVPNQFADLKSVVA